MNIETIYRYRRATKQNIDSLLNTEIWFSQIKYFNDQNEFKISVNIEDLEQKIYDDFKKYSPNQKQKILGAFKYKKFYQGIENIDEYFRSLYNSKSISNDEWLRYVDITMNYVVNGDIVSSNKTLQRYINEYCDAITTIVDDENYLYENIEEFVIKEVYVSKYESSKKFITECTLKNFKFFLNEAFFVCCFSENYDNSVMWGNYANNGDGFVVGYEIATLKTKVLKRIVMN